MGDGGTPLRSCIKSLKPAFQANQVEVSLPGDPGIYHVSPSFLLVPNGTAKTAGSSIRNEAWDAYVQSSEESHLLMLQLTRSRCPRQLQHLLAIQSNRPESPTLIVEAPLLTLLKARVNPVETSFGVEKTL